MTQHKLSQALTSELIEMAWCDKTSFEMIKRYFKLSHNDVKKIMKKELKFSSYRLWRKRVKRVQFNNQKKYQNKKELNHEC